MTRTEILALLRRKQGDRSIREFAGEVGCSASHLSALYKGKWRPGGKVLRFLGLTATKAVTYREAK